MGFHIVHYKCTKNDTIEGLRSSALPVCFLSLPLFLQLVSLAILEEEVEDDQDVGYGVDLFADAPGGGDRTLILRNMLV